MKCNINRMYERAIELSNNEKLSKAVKKQLLDLISQMDDYTTEFGEFKPTKKNEELINRLPAKDKDGNIIKAKDLLNFNIEDESFNITSYIDGGKFSVKDYIGDLEEELGRKLTTREDKDLRYKFLTMLAESYSEKNYNKFIDTLEFDDDDISKDNYKKTRYFAYWKTRRDYANKMLNKLKGIKEPTSTPKFDKLPKYVPGQKTMVYAGVGSRETPIDVMEKMNEISKWLEAEGYSLNSGHANGADKAFEGVRMKYDTTTGIPVRNKQINGNWISTDKNGNVIPENNLKFHNPEYKITNKNIFTADDANDKVRTIAKEIHPAGANLSGYSLDLHARNTFQVFGKNLDKPVDFVIFYAKESKNPLRPDGGTGQAVEMARRKGIPTVNMMDSDWKQQMRDILGLNKNGNNNKTVQPNTASDKISDKDILDILNKIVITRIDPDEGLWVMRNGKPINFGNPFVTKENYVKKPEDYYVGGNNAASIAYYKWLKYNILPDGYNRDYKVLEKRRNVILNNLDIINNASKLRYSGTAKGEQINHVTALIAIAEDFKNKDINTKHTTINNNSNIQGIEISTKSEDPLGVALTNVSYARGSASKSEFDIEPPKEWKLKAPEKVSRVWFKNGQKRTAANVWGHSVEAWYKANNAQIREIPEGAKGDEHDTELMQKLIELKLKTHKEITKEITKRGGVEFLEHSTHNIGNGRWSSKGKGLFIKTLVKAYKNVIQEKIDDNKITEKENLHKLLSTLLENMSTENRTNVTGEITTKVDDKGNSFSRNNRKKAYSLHTQVVDDFLNSLGVKWDVLKKAYENKTNGKKLTELQQKAYDTISNEGSLDSLKDGINLIYELNLTDNELTTENLLKSIDSSNSNSNSSNNNSNNTLAEKDRYKLQGKFEANEDQKKLLDKAVELFTRTSNKVEDSLLIVQGMGGTGKSTVIGRAIELLAETSNTPIKFIGAAVTHQATNVLESMTTTMSGTSIRKDIRTISSLLAGMKVGTTDKPEMEYDEMTNISIPNGRFSLLTALQAQLEFGPAVLVVDEASMLSIDDTKKLVALSNILTNAKHKFSIVMLGDYHQLPPVSSIEVLSPIMARVIGMSQQEKLGSNTIEVLNGIKVMTLSKQQRQNVDSKLFSVISHVASLVETLLKRRDRAIKIPNANKSLDVSSMPSDGEVGFILSKHFDNSKSATWKAIVGLFNKNIAQGKRIAYVAFNNKNIAEFNNKIRKALFKDNKPEANPLIAGKDQVVLFESALTSGITNTNYTNGMVFKVTKVEDATPAQIAENSLIANYVRGRKILYSVMYKNDVKLSAVTLKYKLADKEIETTIVIPLSIFKDMQTLLQSRNGEIQELYKQAMQEYTEIYKNEIQDNGTETSTLITEENDKEVNFGMLKTIARLQEMTPSAVAIGYAYGVTTYKAQGQTIHTVIWDTAVKMGGNNDSNTKSLKKAMSGYTAVSRAKEQLIIVGDKNILSKLGWNGEVDMNKSQSNIKKEVNNSSNDNTIEFQTTGSTDIGYDKDLVKQMVNRLAKLYPEIEYIESPNEIISNQSVNNLYQIGNKKRKEYSNRLHKKRPDLQNIEQVLDSIETYIDNNSIIKEKDQNKYYNIAIKWTIDGNLLLPEDGEKMIGAVRLAATKKIDPMQFNNPNEIFDKYGEDIKQDTYKSAKLNPDTIPEFTNKKIVKNKDVGEIVLYSVDNTKNGQLAVRKIINHYWGKSANPWCLTYTDDNGKLTKDSWTMWNEKYAGSKYIAFQNGKLIAFSASNFGDEYSWWDRADNSTDEYIPIKRKLNGWTELLKYDIKNNNLNTETIVMRYKGDKNDITKPYIEYNNNNIKIVDRHISNNHSVTISKVYNMYEDEWFEKKADIDLQSGKGTLLEENIYYGNYQTIVGEIDKIGRRIGIRAMYSEDGLLSRKEYYNKEGSWIKTIDYHEDGVSPYIITHYENRELVSQEVLDTPSANVYTFPHEELIPDEYRFEYFQKSNTNRIKGMADLDAMKILINTSIATTDTPSHEYAHFYIHWFKNTPIVQEAIKKWGSEEALVQAIGEQAVRQKGEAWGWWKKFSNWLIDLFNQLPNKDKEELKNLLTDAFLERKDLSSKNIIKDLFNTISTNVAEELLNVNEKGC